MMEVNGQRLEFQITPHDSCVVQPCGNLVVLAPPADERLVEAVDSDQIALPVRLVAAADGPLPGALLEHQRTQEAVANGVPAPTDVTREESQLQLAPLQHPGRGVG